MVGAWVKRSALAAAVVGFAAAGAARAQTTAPPTSPGGAATEAGTAKAKTAKPKPAKPKVGDNSSIAVVVTNHRPVGLVELTATLVTGLDSVKIAGPLAAGKQVVAHVVPDKACLYDIKGRFADGAEIEMNSYDMCKDKKIDLID